MSTLPNATSNGASLFDAVSSGLLGLVLSTILTVVITVVITFLIQNYLNRPQIKGKILNFITLDFDSSKTGHKTAFWVYTYLTNYHKNSISIVDYELEVDFGNGYVKLDRVYGDISKILPEVIPVKTNLGDITLKNFGKHLLYKNSPPVRYGRFNHGFVMFVGDPSLKNKKAKKLKFTCIDVFNQRHIIENRFETLFNLNLLLEILDIAESP